MFDSDEYTALRDSSEAFRSRVAELNDIAASRGTVNFGPSWKMEVFSATPVETNQDDGYLVSGLISFSGTREVAGDRKSGEEVFVGIFIPLSLLASVSLPHALWSSFSSNAIELCSTRYEFILMHRVIVNLSRDHADAVRGRGEVFGFALDNLRDVLREGNHSEHGYEVETSDQEADTEEVITRTLDRLKREDEAPESIEVTVKLTLPGDPTLTEETVVADLLTQAGRDACFAESTSGEVILGNKIVGTWQVSGGRNSEDEKEA